MNNSLSTSKQDILFHPIVLGTIFLYFINNLLFQQLWHSQITGKISDFSWLFFTPIIINSFIASAVHPQRLAKWNIDIAIWAGIGLVYILIKTVPTINNFIVQIIEKGTGFPVIVKTDSTDLLALISLLGGFYFWRTTKNWSTRFSSKSIYFLSLAAFLTLADMAAADYGINCLETKGGLIIASSTYTNYVSNDGGENWNNYEGEAICLSDVSEQGRQEIGDETLRVRFEANKPIEISTDNGISWVVEYDLKPDTQAQQAYYQKFREGNAVFSEGPFSAIIDKRTNNLLFAMGHEGVLIRKSNGLWQWVSVGAYKRVDYSNPNLYVLLWGEGILALASGFLIFSALGVKKILNKNGGKIIGTTIFTVAIYFLFEFIKFAFPPSISFGYAATLSTVLVIGVLLILCILSTSIYIQLKQNFGQIKKLLLLSSLSAFLFFLSYCLWFINLLPNYYLAPGLTAFTQIGIIIWGWENKTTSQQSVQQP